MIVKFQFLLCLKNLKIVYFQIKDRILSANDRILLGKIAYFQPGSYTLPHYLIKYQEMYQCNLAIENGISVHSTIQTLEFRSSRDNQLVPCVPFIWWNVLMNTRFRSD